MHEEAVGKAIGRAIGEGIVKREELFVSTKLWPTLYEDNTAVDKTLERMGLDYVDLLFIHQPAGNFVAGCKQLEKAYADGKAKSLGISNFHSEKLTKLLAETEIRPHVIQIEAHPYCTEKEIMSRSFWGELAKCCQTEFKKNGTNGKCIEARELVIALPEEFINIKPDELLEFFVEKFREKYDVPCVAALHHNKRKTNHHIHLIFLERRLLDEPAIKTATRNMFYDESGKHVRTKKEILDGDGKVRRGCKVIKKGEIYERILFDKKDARFKQKGFLNEVKVYLTDQINMLVKTSEEKLKVFDRNSAYLPMKKIGKNNPLEEEIKKDNEARTRWNETVDQAVIAEVPELEIIRVKQEHVTVPVKESIEKDGYRPWRFRNIVLMAVWKLEEVIERVVSAAKEMKERIDRLMERIERSREENSAIKTDTGPTIDNATHPKEENTYEKAYQNNNEPNGSSDIHIEPSYIFSKAINSDSTFHADVDGTEALNKRIISGEMSIESAIQFMSEKGYKVKTVQMKESELSGDVSIRARIARSRQMADEYNRSRQQRDRDRNSRGAR